MAQALSDYLYTDEAARVEALLKALPWDRERHDRVQEKAASMVEKLRAGKRRPGEMETFLQQYSLTTEEGLALMGMAEALLRIPDSRTAKALIRDKVGSAEWTLEGSPADWMVRAAGLGMVITRKTLDSIVAKLGEGVIRQAMLQAIRIMGNQFVVGQTIDSAMKNARAYEKKGYRMSYDMLGEGARTMEDAARYYQAYVDAIEALGKTAAPAGQNRMPSISVKLSALHPRYRVSQEERCVPVLVERLTELGRLAARRDIALTVDAEEVERLELSLKIIDAVSADAGLSDWDGLGLAIQAYSKRTLPLIDHLFAMAQNHRRRLGVRLVKGAYWDTEIKRAQMLGLPDYPVFTRKANTDLSYLACAHRLLVERATFYPMLATHNAHSIAAILEMAGNGRDNFEFQRLHGMGEGLHDQVLEGGAQVSVYAPVGSHQDLLPYLVRRLLENGANSSFVHQLLDQDVPVQKIIADPVEDARNHPKKRHPRIVRPVEIYGPGRRNAIGLDLTDAATTGPLLRMMQDSVDGKKWEAAPLIGGKLCRDTTPRDITNPASRKNVIGTVWYADAALVDRAFETAKTGFARWSRVPADRRADALNRLADLMESNRAELMGLCVREAGKTVEDALAEIREAVDFCRYYAMRGRADFIEDGRPLPGPTGESNRLMLGGRGVFVCISPWNFPLAIFTGQITAALMAGNAVIAKPAEQTPIIAMRMARLILEAGIDADAFTLLPGDGKVGAMLTAHPDVAGVAFTGSTEVARAINRTLAEKDGPIVPLIAETGGQNAMIVDSSALPEQVIDDVLVSAFGSTGQRCSALRVLFLQDDIADKTLHMLKGAMAELRVGDPVFLSSDLGPVIDDEALENLIRHKAALDGFGRKIAEAPMDPDWAAQGYFFAPVAYEIDSLSDLKREVFGPVLHVIRYKAKEIDAVIESINATGYGLTLGVHSRIEAVMKKIANDAHVGNAYVNRTMIGAVVGVQPFGGHGLSGTGPKAGGPYYLPRFATEKVVTINTTASGGNASLVSLEE